MSNIIVIDWKDYISIRYVYPALIICWLIYTVIVVIKERRKRK